MVAYTVEIQMLLLRESGSAELGILRSLKEDRLRTQAAPLRHKAQ